MYFDKRMNNGLIPYVYVLQLRFDGFLTELYARKGGKYQRMRVSAAAPIYTSGIHFNSQNDKDYMMLKQPYSLEFKNHRLWQHGRDGSEF